MPALASPSTWRSHPYTYKQYLYIDDPTVDVVFAAQVNEPGSITYPLASVEVDNVTTGSIGDALAGYTVYFGLTPGDRGLGTTRVRNTGSGTSLDIAETSDRTALGLVKIVDNAYVTVVKERRIWPVTQRFSSGVLYKDYDIAYNGGSGGRIFTDEPGPIANINLGCAVAGNIDPSTSKLTLVLDGTDSEALSPSTTISTYLWDVDGGTITVGTTGSSGITATFTEGRYYVSLTVTDSAGDTHTQYLFVAACNPDGTTKAITSFAVTEHSLAQDGAVMGFEIYDTTPQDYIGGSIHIYWEEEVYNGTEGSLAGPSSAEHVKFVGWPDVEEGTSRTATEDGPDARAQRRCLGPVRLLSIFKADGQSIIDDGGTASSWLTHTSLTIDRLMWYLLRWHSTIHELTYTAMTGVSTAVTGFSSSGEAQSLRGMIREAETYAETYCDRLGRWFFDDPLEVRLDEARSATIVSLTEADMTSVQAGISFAKFREIVVSGFNAGSSLEAILSIAPGNTPDIGVQASRYGPYYVVSQTELNRRAGLIFAELNTTIQYVDLELLNTGDAGLDPGVGDTVSITLDGTYFPRGQSLSSTECEILSITTQYTNHDDGNRTKRVNMRVRPTPTEYTVGVTYSP